MRRAQLTTSKARRQTEGVESLQQFAFVVPEFVLRVQAMAEQMRLALEVLSPEVRRLVTLMVGGTLLRKSEDKP